MIRRGIRPARALAWGLLASSAAAAGAGCGATRSPIPEGALIKTPTAPPLLPPPPPPPDNLPPVPAPEAVPGDSIRPPEQKDKPPEQPAGPTARPGGPLKLDEVLASVQTHFPLLFAVEQERGIAAGRRLAAEGEFDLNLRSRGVNRSGTFASSALDAGVQRFSPTGGVSTFAGWRIDQGNYPVYYGDRKTADGGEFRAGVNVPLLRDAPIDPRRAALRRAQIAENLADPTVRAARIDYVRNAGRAYWAWVGAGAGYQIARELFQLASDRQAGLEEGFAKGQKGINQTVVDENARIIKAREGDLTQARRGLEQAAFALSLFLRDDAGNPVVPPPELLPKRFLDLTPPRPDPARLEDDVVAALNQRPEPLQFQFQKEQMTVDLRLAQNQLQPGVDVFVQGNQDVGQAKKTFGGEGIFRTNRTVGEVGVVLDVPVERRNALGRVREAQARLNQLLGRERFVRDDITAQVQDAVSELTRTYERVMLAREELRKAVAVRDQEEDRFRRGQSDILALNFREIFAAEAQTRVGFALVDYFTAVANYLAALGVDTPVPGKGGCVLPQTAPLTGVPDPLPAPPPPDPLPPPRPLPAPPPAVPPGEKKP